MAAAGTFRLDLFYRLSVITLELPVLRQRGGDIDVLIAHFLRAATPEGKPQYRLTGEAALALRSYPFPGNVRELENAIRRAVALCPNAMITLDCLPPEIAVGLGTPTESVTSHNEATIIADRPSMDELQRRYLQLVLDENQGKKRRAAAVLGLDRRTVQRLVVSGRILGRTIQVLIGVALALACSVPAARAQVTSVEARIASVSGTALLSTGAQPPSIAKRGDVLFPGEEIDTRGGGHVTIELTDGSIVLVRSGSRILLKDFRTAGSVRELFEILLGRVRVKINHWGGKPNPYRINSPTASIAVRGTEFSVAVNEIGETEVVVYEGLVEVTNISNPQNKVLVNPGQGVIVRPNQDIHFFAFNPAGEIGGLGGSQEAGSKNPG